MKKLLPIVLLLSFSVQAEEVTKEVTHEVAFADDVTAFVKEMPGKVLVAEGDVDLEAAKAEGYDAVVFEAKELDLDGLTVKTRSLNDKAYSIVIFDTDAKDDIIDWLAE